MKIKKVVLTMTNVFITIFILLVAVVPMVKSQEAAQIYLRFDDSSTTLLVRVTVVISSSEPVGAFQAEYEYDTSYLRLENITSNNGGTVYSSSSKGNVKLIYMNENPRGEDYLTFEFSVVREGNSSVMAFYQEILTKDKSSLEFKNNNDCNIHVGTESVTASSSASTKTSSSSSGGKVSVIKDSDSSAPSTKPVSGENNESKNDDDHTSEKEFFDFKSDSPVFWTLLGAFCACGIMFVAYTGYKMGIKKAASQNFQNKSERMPKLKDDIDDT